MQDFVTSWFDHLENTGLLSSIDLPDVAIFYLSKITFDSLLSLSEKSFNYWEASRLWWQIRVFQSSDFLVKACILSLAINI